VKMTDAWIIVDHDTASEHVLEQQNTQENGICKYK